MPRFFFDLHDLDTPAPAAWGQDDTGTELVDVDAAREAALRFLPAYVQDGLTVEVVERRTIELRVRDEGGQVFYRVRLVLSGHREAA